MATLGHPLAHAELLVDEDAPFGVDLLLPAVGGNARATNYDYTHGQLGELIDVVIKVSPTVAVMRHGHQGESNSAHRFPPWRITATPAFLLACSWCEVVVCVDM